MPAPPPPVPALADPAPPSPTGLEAQLGLGRLSPRSWRAWPDLDSFTRAAGAARHFIARHEGGLAAAAAVAAVAAKAASAAAADPAARLAAAWATATTFLSRPDQTALAAAVLATAVATAALLSKHKRRVFLVDFAVFRPPAAMDVPMDGFKAHIREPGTPFSDESIRFMDRVLDVAGVGPLTAMPLALRDSPPWNPTFDAAKAESEEVLYSVVAGALRAARLKPSDVDFLVVNCSVYCPTPSLSAMIVNKFRMAKPGLTTYSLGGMGCSAGLIALDLAREALASRPAGQVALVVSTENITAAIYQGSDRSMLVPATLFRVGGSAVVLTNAGPLSRLRRRAKYELTHLVRTHLGRDDRAFQCVHQAADADGVVGVRLSRELMSVAGDALRKNITALGPAVLPLTEQAHYVARAAHRAAAKALGVAPPKPYVPDFTTAFDHFCVHPGGRAVLEEVAKSLRLSPEAALPSAATLWRHGNTSSSSVWYVLAWIESAAAVAAKQAAAKAAGQPGLTVPWPPAAAGLAPPRAVRKGDRVWQIAFGSGFKCNSAVLKARRNIGTLHSAYDDF